MDPPADGQVGYGLLIVFTAALALVGTLEPAERAERRPPREHQVHIAIRPIPDREVPEGIDVASGVARLELKEDPPAGRVDAREVIPDAVVRLRIRKAFGP